MAGCSEIRSIKTQCRVATIKTQCRVATAKLSLQKNVVLIDNLKVISSVNVPYCIHVLLTEFSLLQQLLSMNARTWILVLICVRLIHMLSCQSALCTHPINERGLHNLDNMREIVWRLCESVRIDVNA